MRKNSKAGFTLLELLIVIAILAVLSVALVLVLNPAETLKKSRDAQRISDLSTIKTAIGLYLTSTATPYLGGISSNLACFASANDAAPSGSVKIFYSVPSTGTNSVAITATNLDGAVTYAAAAQPTTAAAASLTDGTGWIPVNFSGLTGGSPISNIPVDPLNTLGGGDSATSLSNASYFYRYACSQSPLAFEIDAALESTAYTVTDDKRVSDGGDNPNFYEVGTNLKILGIANNF